LYFIPLIGSLFSLSNNTEDEESFVYPRSGNPKGRPKSKESENQSDSLAKELSTTVHLKINGETQNMKAMDAISKQIVTQAIKGNISILKKFMDSPVIDSYLFKDAMNKYNRTSDNAPKALTPELRIIVNKVKGMIRDKLENEKEQKKRGEIE